MFGGSLEGLRDSEAVVVMAIVFYNNRKRETISDKVERKTDTSFPSHPQLVSPRTASFLQQQNATTYVQ